MIKLTSLFLAIALTTQCSQDETLRAYGAADRLWRLQELNGVPFSANTQLSFPEKEQVTVQGPCNRMSGTNKLPYPWFSFTLISSTKKACPELGQENIVIDALNNATLVEILNDVMILSNTEDLNMVFRAVD